MKLTVLHRLVVLAALIAGLAAPSLTAAAAPARPASNQAAFAVIDRLLAADGQFAMQADKKKLPSERKTPTPAEEKTPAATNKPCTSSSDALLGVLGGNRADFEDEFGAPADDADAADFAIGEIYTDIHGYDSINVFWDNDVALHIQLNANTGWTETKALSTANEFLPSDVQLDSKATELDGGELLYAGSSEALGGEISRSTYRSYKVGGTAGDLRVILIPGDKDTFAKVDIAIGAGDEFGGGSSVPTKEATAEPTAKSKTLPRATEAPVKTPTSKKKGGTVAPDEYLTNIRSEVDTRQKEMDRFVEIIGLGAAATDADITDLTDILVSWSALPAYDAPSGYAEIDDAYTSLSENLASAATNLIVYFGDTTDTTSLDTASASLTTARTLLSDLDTLLKNEGY
ncbi:MAG: hypothetical protein ACR2OE_06300 [Thermomicrobiales bacterium]